MALTPEEQAELDQLTSMMIPSSGAAANPANQAVLEQAASNPASGPSPAVAPAVAPGPLDQGFQRGADFSGARPQDTQLTANDVNEAFLSIPGMPALAEYAQSFNKSVADTIDFLGPDILNSILEIAGSEKRVPTAGGALEELTGGEQQFMDPGLARDAVKAGGEYSTLALGMSQLLKKLPSMLPAFAETSGKSQIGVGMAEQLGKNARPITDTAMGAASGMGATYGQEYGGDAGELAGALVAPLSLGMTTPLISNAFKDGGPQIAKVVAELDRFNKIDAGKMLAKQLVRENMTVDQAVKKFESLGTDAVPADIGASFRALLREAGNQYPRVFGAAGEQLKNRAKDQPRRILNAFDDASETSMLNLQGEIQRIDDMFKPEVKSLYDQARSKGLPLSEKVRSMLEKSPTLKKAAQTAQDMMDDARAIGETPGTIDFINNVKLVIDDQINKLVNQGGSESGKIANLVKLKGPMLKEADEAIPEYAQARKEFSSLAELKAAGDVGQNIFKLSESPLDFKALVDDMTPAQLKLAKLGVKEAIIKKFNDTQETSNSIKQMFGKRGSLQKAEYLWGKDKEGFKKFQDALEREAEFVITRNEAIGGSTSAKQLTDIGVGTKDAAMDSLRKQLEDSRGWKRKAMDLIVGIWAKEKTPAKADALETAGDLLMLKGLNGEDVRKILKTADPMDIQKIIMESLEYTGIPDSVYSVPAVTVGAKNLVEKISE